MSSPVTKPVPPSSSVARALFQSTPSKLKGVSGNSRAGASSSSASSSSSGARRIPAIKARISKPPSDIYELKTPEPKREAPPRLSPPKKRANANCSPVRPTRSLSVDGDELPTSNGPKVTTELLDLTGAHACIKQIKADRNIASFETPWNNYIVDALYARFSTFHDSFRALKQKLSPEALAAQKAKIAALFINSYRGFAKKYGIADAASVQIAWHDIVFDNNYFSQQAEAYAAADAATIMTRGWPPYAELKKLLHATITEFEKLADKDSDTNTLDSEYAQKRAQYLGESLGTWSIQAWVDELSRPDFQIIVTRVEGKGKIIGLLLQRKSIEFYGDHEAMEISLICVHPDVKNLDPALQELKYRRQGYGYALLAKAQKQATVLGYKSLMTTLVQARMKPAPLSLLPQAQALYKKFGFKETRLLRKELPAYGNAFQRDAMEYKLTLDTVLPTALSTPLGSHDLPPWFGITTASAEDRENFSRAHPSSFSGLHTQN